MSKITERLDRIASQIEPVNPQMALAIDKISDRLEGKPPLLEALLEGIRKAKPKLKKLAYGEPEQLVRFLETFYVPADHPDRKKNIEQIVDTFAMGTGAALTDKWGVPNSKEEAEKVWRVIVEESFKQMDSKGGKPLQPSQAESLLEGMAREKGKTLELVSKG